MSPWWGDYEFSVHQTLRWQIGPKTLWITRGDREWRVITAEGRDSLDSRLSIAEEGGEPAGDGVDARRFALRSESCAIRLEPALPDLSLIVKPAVPFFVTTMEEVTLYVSTPLWLRVLVGESSTELVDVALTQPSETWFGPDTMGGELCYASRSSARLHRESLPVRPHRCISVLRICNSAKSMLKLEKLKVPVQHLGLYSSEDGNLWTESLIFERESDTADAQVRIADKPERTMNVSSVAAPRLRASMRFSLEAFGGLFGKRGET
jgi:hypothetical protein